MPSVPKQIADYLFVGGYALAACGDQPAAPDIDPHAPASAQAVPHLQMALPAMPDQATKNIDIARLQEWIETPEWPMHLELTFF